MTASGGGGGPLQHDEYYDPREVFAAISAAVRLNAPDHVIDVLVAKGFEVWTSTGYRLNDVWALNRRN